MRPFNPIWPKIPLSEQDWRNRAYESQSLQIEIGAGVGLHAIQLSQSQPKSFVIALERTEEKSAKMLRRVSQHQSLPNLLALRADAIQWIWQNIVAQEVAHYYLLYPNPHPKSSQANQRWINMPFFSYLIETLQVSGTITLATNIASYFDEFCKRAVEAWGLHVQKAGQLPSDFVGRTHFERKYLARNEPCFECVLRKRP